MLVHSTVPNAALLLRETCSMSGVHAVDQRSMAKMPTVEGLERCSSLPQQTAY